MIACPSCGHNNETMTAYCHRCASALPISHSRSRSRSSPAVGPRSTPPIAEESRARDFIVRKVHPFWRRFWPQLFLVAALAACILTLKRFLTVENRLAVRGHRFEAFAMEGKPLFFVGLQQDLKVIAQRDGQFDTQLLTLRATETGVIKPETTRDPSRIRIGADNWIRVEEAPNASRSIALKPNDPTLTAVTLVIGENHQVSQRLVGEGQRTGRALMHLLPKWPDRVLRRYDTWEERIEWHSSVGEWLFRWAAQLHWKLAGYEACGDSRCGRFTYSAHLQPTLVKAPAWAAKRLFQLRHSTQGHGQALIDVANNRLVDNTFAFQSDIKIPFNDLRAIPDDFRRTQLPEATPGEIAFSVKEKVSLTRP